MNDNKLNELRRKQVTLIEEIEKIKKNYNYNEGFMNSNDLDRFIEENQSILKEANEVSEKIRTLEWELLSPEERKEKEEQRSLSKLKREGKFF